MSSSGEVTKNERAWNQLFEKYRILEQIVRQGYFEITATQINEFREARLMTKFDHRINLPKQFSDNDLAILPISRGGYVIAQLEAYQDFPPLNGEIIRVSFPEHIQSIDYENITSEAMALNCAYVSGIMADFLNDEELFPTVSGRMSSERFSFQIRKKGNSTLTINVENSQMEIDGGFEGLRRVALIEAKNFLSEDFLIRQLYYPYRLWSTKVFKQVAPVFLVYSNGIYSLYEYEFQDPDSYNSLVLVKQRNYSIEAENISLDDIVAVLDEVQSVPEPKVAFPQADSFRRVVNLCELLSEGDLTRDDITLNYAFDPRQTNYYTDAGRYLGLIDKHRENREVKFSLTRQGRNIIRSKYKSRQLKFVESILQHDVFRKTLRLCLQRGEMPPRGDIVKIMRECRLYQVEAESTFSRRASTISGWLNWILELQSTKQVFFRISV